MAEASMKKINFNCQSKARVYEGLTDTTFLKDKDT